MLNQQQLELILNSKRIANAGCFANGMLCILNPIKDYLNQNMPLIMNGVTGYSAGGKQTIEKQNLNENEQKLGYALLEIFGNFDKIFQVGDGNKFNKNLILLSLREMTSLSTKEIRIALKRYKKLYDGILGGFLE